jgi:hypothetical protein
MDCKPFVSRRANTELRTILASESPSAPDRVNDSVDSVLLMILEPQESAFESSEKVGEITLRITSKVWDFLGGDLCGGGGGATSRVGDGDADARSPSWEVLLCTE